jgi:hypothetical protein
MAHMWEYRDEHELAEGKRKHQEDHARFLDEVQERKAREKREANAQAREKILALRKAEPFGENTMSDAAPQYVTIEQYRRLVKHVNELTANFNTINQEVEQLKETVNTLKPGKQTKKSGFQGRSAELEAELDDLSPSKTPEIDTTEVASKLAKVLAKGNAQ